MVKNLFLIIISVATFGCSAKGIKPDSDVTEKWFEAPHPVPSDEISKVEAQQFINDFFGLLDQVIFDPNYRSEDLKKVKNDLESQLDSFSPITRKDVTSGLNKKINEIHLSHLGVLDPEKSQLIVKMSGQDKNEKPEPAVSAKMLGKVGVIKISSFLVPSVTLQQIEAARSKVKSAKYLIYDMRNNAGGSVSSNSYVIENILGPDMTVQYSRDRKGAEIKSPFVKEGYFSDESNFGSEADIDLENKYHFVEWKTRRQAVKDTRSTVIVVNSHCGSSCDVFTAAIKENGAAKIVGTKTAGAVLGGVMFKLSWKAYTAIMPVSQLISPQGKLYEGVGITPDVEIKSCDDEKSDECIKEAIRLFKK